MDRADSTFAFMSVNGSARSHDQSCATGLAPHTLPFLAASLKKQCRRYRKQLRKCRHKFSGNSVHDLRVSARRLLSLLDLLAPFLQARRLKKLQFELKRHLDTFDDLRDVQVQIPAVRRYRAEFPAACCFHRFLKKRESRLSRSTRKKARRLRSKPLGKLLQRAAHDLDEQVHKNSPAETIPLLIHAVDQAFSLAKTRKDRIDAADTHSIHCARVAFKQFRYVVDALKDSWPGVEEAVLAKMHDYQALLGDIQDADVLLKSFQKFARKKRLGASRGLEFERALHDRRQRRIKKYLAQADELLNFWPLPGENSARGPGAVNRRAARRRAGRGRTSAKKNL